MPNLSMSGDIGFEELSPQLQALIQSGGSGGGIAGNVSLKTEVLSVIATVDRQKEFTIPKSNYIQDTHNFELRLGSVWIHPDRYQIQGNKVVLNASEAGIAIGRRLDFVFCYIEGDGSAVNVDGSTITDGTVSKDKLSTSLQAEINNAVTSVEASNNYNSIRVVKNDGTAEDVPLKILGGGTGTPFNVFKTSETTGSFTATAETNSFVIDKLEENMDVALVFKNLYLVNNVDFTVDKSLKTVVLSFNLKANETIHYILTGTSFEYDELNGAPNVGDTNSLATTSKEVVGAINEVNAKLPNGTIATLDDLASIDGSNVQDGSVGKSKLSTTLQAEIENKVMNIEKTQTGIRVVKDGGVANEIEIGGNVTKTPVYCVPCTGHRIINQESYIMNEILYLCVVITQTANGNYNDVTDFRPVFELPFEPFPNACRENITLNACYVEAIDANQGMPYAVYEHGEVFLFTTKCDGDGSVVAISGCFYVGE